MRGHVRKRGNTCAVVYDEGRGEDGKRPAALAWGVFDEGQGRWPSDDPLA
jgi:hypothetical protein